MDLTQQKMKMCFRTLKSGPIKTLFEALKEILGDVNITFDEAGIRLTTMDGSHVALVHLRLHADNFEHYECDNLFKIGTSIPSLAKLLKDMTGSDIITFYVLEDHPDELCIEIQNPEKRSTDNLKLHLIDVNEDILEIKKVEFESRLSMPSREFQRICRNMGQISDIVEIKSSNGNLVFESSNDTTSRKTELKETLVNSNGTASQGLSFSTHDKNVAGKFSARYLNLFTKATDLCNTIEICLRNDYPLMINYSVASLGELIFCLAPKVSMNI